MCGSQWCSSFLDTNT